MKKSLAKKRVGCEKFITSWLKKIHYLLYYFTMLRHKLKFSWRLFVPGENPKWKSVLNNEPFTRNGYIVQKTPCWTANETVGPWKKGYFVLNDEISFFLLLLCVVCQKARCFLYHVTISCEGLIVDLEKKNNRVNFYLNVTLEHTPLYILLSYDINLCCSFGRSGSLNLMFDHRARRSYLWPWLQF